MSLGKEWMLSFVWGMREATDEMLNGGFGEKIFHSFFFLCCLSCIVAGAW